MDKDKKYVVLRHLTMPDKGRCFFTTNTPDTRTGRGRNGELWYEAVGFADTVEEAQGLCSSMYGGLPSQREFDEWAKAEVESRYKDYFEDETSNK